MTVRVHEYRIAVDLRGDETVSCTTTVRFAASALSTIIDIDGLRPRSAVLNGVALDVTGHRNSRLLLPELSAENEFVLYGDSDPGAVRQYRDPVDGRRYVTAGADTVGAPNWFARFGAPDRKAAVLLDVRCPDGWTVVGNGPSTRIDKGHWRVRADRPLPTHLTAFAAGSFHTVRSCHDGITMTFHARASMAARLGDAAADLFVHAAACLDEFHRLLDIRFPWAACTFVFVPNAPWRGMEYPGCVQLRETLLPDGRTPGEWVVVLAHELAHMWFGNLVSPRHSGDVWLFEAIAEYLGQRIAGTVAGDSVVRSMNVRRRPAAYRAARRPGSRALIRSRTPVGPVGYVKGAAALSDLRARLGESVFVEALRGFLTARRDGVGAPVDLLEHLCAAGGRDLPRWWRDWLADSGIGAVSVDDDRVVVAGAKVPTAVSVRAVDRRGDTLGRWRVAISDGSGPLPPAPRGTALMLPNEDDAAWAYTRLSPADWRLLPETAPRLDLPVRSMVWTAVRMAVSDAELDPAPALDVVTALLAGETDEALLDTGATWTTGVLLWRHPPAGEARVAAALARAFTTAEPGSGVQAAAGRHWIDVADARQLRGMVGRLHGRLRWRAMTRLAVLGALEEREIESACRHDGSGDTAVPAARCRAALPDRVAKENTWRLLTSDPGVTIGERVAAARMFWHPRHRNITAPFLPRYFAYLAASGPSAVLLARHGFPHTAHPPDVLARAERILRNPMVAQQVRTAVSDAADDMRCRCRVMAATAG